MIQAQLQDAAREWRQNRRLRLGAMAILAILGIQCASWLSEARAARVEAYDRSAALLSRLEAASRESAWIERADDAEARLAALRDSIPAVDSEGLAQAETQAWLADLAALSGIGNPVIRVENAIAVEGQPGMWQVLARLDGPIAPSGVPVAMRALAAARPWFQAERVELQDGATPRFALVLRAYYREGPATSGLRRPGDLPAAAASAAAQRPAAQRGNPLAPGGLRAGSGADAAAPGRPPATATPPQTEATRPRPPRDTGHGERKRPARDRLPTDPAGALDRRPGAPEPAPRSSSPQPPPPPPPSPTTNRPPPAGSAGNWQPPRGSRSGGGGAPPGGRN